MNEIQYINWNEIADDAIERQIGLFIKRTRQTQNKTQSEVAKAANISRSTLSLLEKGQSGNLITLIQVLRVLDQLHILKSFQYKQVASPLALAKMQHGTKQRVRPKQKKNSLTSENNQNW